jgi:hypothetical protein
MVYYASPSATMAFINQYNVETQYGYPVGNSTSTLTMIAVKRPLQESATTLCQAAAAGTTGRKKRQSGQTYFPSSTLLAIMNAQS